MKIGDTIECVEADPAAPVSVGGQFKVWKLQEHWVMIDGYIYWFPRSWFKVVT